jgi:putative NADH-flavin reductase
MKLLIIGATGMIGSRILNEAVERGHSVIAAARKPENIEASANVEAVKLDLHDAEQFQKLASKTDVIVAAASPRNTGDAQSEAVDYANALIAGSGDTRLMLVGGAGSLNLPDGTPVAEVVPEEYRDEAKGMRKAFELIADSSLDYTVHAPAGLIQPGERTGKFRLGGRTFLTDAEGNSAISAEDYAVAHLDEIENPAHKRDIFTAAY